MLSRIPINTGMIKPPQKNYVQSPIITAYRLGIKIIGKAKHAPNVTTAIDIGSARG